MKPAHPHPRTRPQARPPQSWEGARGDFIQSLAGERRSEFTLDHYRDYLDAFESWWNTEGPGRPPEDGRERTPLTPREVTEEDILEWNRRIRTEVIHETTKKSRKAASVNVMMAALKSFLGWCHRKGVITRLPEFPPPERIGDRPVKWLDKKQQRRLLSDASRANDPRAHPIVKVFLETGVRLSEFVALKWRDVEISERKGELAVIGKGNKPRGIPLNKHARKAFTALRELAPPAQRGPDDPVATSRRSGKGGRYPRLSARAVQDIVAEFDVHPHQLRHTFGMNLQKAGVPLPVIAKLMGHGSIVTTLTHYGTPSYSDLRAAVEREEAEADDD
jgi:integrase